MDTPVSMKGVNASAWSPAALLPRLCARISRLRICRPQWPPQGRRFISKFAGRSARRRSCRRRFTSGRNRSRSRARLITELTGGFDGVSRAVPLHEGSRMDSAAGGIATIGITDYAQHELGDVVFVDLPKPGAKIEAGKSFGTVESVKAVSEIYAPAAGEVLEANGELQNAPEKINSDPHGSAWLIKVRLANPAEVNALMDAAAYEKFIAEKGQDASA